MGLNTFHKVLQGVRDANASTSELSNIPQYMIVARDERETNDTYTDL